MACRTQKRLVLPTHSTMNTTMSSPKPLHEILSHDQEPFLLHDYILQRRRQINHTLSKTKLRDFNCPLRYDFRIKRVRFVGSRDPNKFTSAGEFPGSPSLKSAVSLRVPARTGAMLLEAASRIQRSSFARLPRKLSLGKGFLGLILKRFTRWKSKKARFRGYGDGDEPSQVETAYGDAGHVCDQNSCESSLLFETPDCTISDIRSPGFPSPAVFLGHFVEGNEEEVNLRPKGMNVDEEKEEREQFSPVSVLDPPFEVDDEDVDSPVLKHEEEDGDGGDTGFGYDCSYAFVQRTKEQLLDKLQRFERLARLDPVELEKRVMDSDDEQSDSEHEDCVSTCFHFPRRSHNGISKLVADLIAEEAVGFESISPEDRRSVIGRVNKRLESWGEEEEVELLRAQWKPADEEFGMLAKEIEVCMLQSLLEEFTQFVE